MDAHRTQSSLQFPGDGLQVHEVAEASSRALTGCVGIVGREKRKGREGGNKKNEILLNYHVDAGYKCQILLKLFSCLVTSVDRSPSNSLTDPISYCRQQASLKSVTGESSAWMG